MITPKLEAVLDLMRAASDCPKPYGSDQFWNYQNSVMEPIRERIRKASDVHD